MPCMPLQKKRWLFRPVCLVTSVALHDYNLSWYVEHNVYLSAYHECKLLLHYILLQKYSTVGLYAPDFLCEIIISRDIIVT